MKNLILSLFIIVGISSFSNRISAAYRMPFNDNLDLIFTQTWHPSGSYYNSNYGWSTGPNYAIDLARSNGAVTDVIAPENGVVMYRENCLYSTNLVLEFGGYEMQFYHLNKNLININTGDTVNKGQKLGTLFSGPFQDGCGSSQGTHLHLRFETPQGLNDSQRITISGYTFDEYDYGYSECMMHRVNNGQNSTYCWGANGTSDVFTANEPGGGSTNCTIKTNWVTNGPSTVSSPNCVTVKTESTIRSTGGTTRLYIQ